jgi:hypothetical protein
MENELAATNKRTEARTYLMDAKSVAYLLAPCILFTLMACLAVIAGIDYAAMPKDKVVLERYRKDVELRKIVAANIAAGDPIPDRETMLEELDARDERTKAWAENLVACANSMRQMGIGVFIAIAAQFYVVFKLRAHIKKLALAGGDNAMIGSMPAETPRKFPIIFLAVGGAVALWLIVSNRRTESESSSATQPATTRIDAHADLRAKYFTLTRNDACPKPATPNEPWGVMMEIGYPKMVMTTVAFSDGTASVMRSSGGGFFGSGAIGPVKAAAEDFLKEARKPHPEMKPAHEYPQPGRGYVTFYLFTDNGTLTWSGDGLDLEGPMTSLSRLRLTGERILYEYIQLEKQKPKESPNKPGTRPHLSPQNDTSL